MPRNLRAFLIAAALLAATACSAPGAARTPAALPTQARPATSSAAPPAAPPAKAKPVGALSVSFVSPSTGWLLAQPQCPDQAYPCKATVLMRKTVNGGRSWFAVPGPPAPLSDMSQSSPPADGVGQILFTSTRDGWAYGPALWQTTDGGATWRRLRVPGQVSGFAVSDGRMLAIIGGCDSAGNCAFRGYAAAAGTDDWRPLPGTAMTGAGIGGPQLAVSGPVGYLLETTREVGRPALLTGPVTGSARWRPLPVPCPHAWSGAIAAVGGWLFLGCGSEPGAGNQLKTAYLSRDGGRTWHQVASPPFGGYLGGASMSRGGTIFLSGSRMDIYISRDRGASWHESPSLASAAGQANAGLSLAGTTVTDSFGVAVQEGVYTQQVWLTRDGGRQWTSVTVH